MSIRNLGLSKVSRTSAVVGALAVILAVIAVIVGYKLYVKAATTNSTPYNHYALLCSIENLFGLEKLGYAGMQGLACFDSKVYNNPKGTTKVTGLSG